MTTLVPIGLSAGRPVLGLGDVSTIWRGGGNMTGLPTVPQAEPYYRTVNAIWPDLMNQGAIIAPARNGVDRHTGRMLQGWPHVEQSMEVIFATPYHERILRRWVGSFVPHLLGESIVPRIITRFFWAIITAIDLNEPNYRIKQIYFMGETLTNWAPQTLDAASLIRLGQAMFRQEGMYRPRAHIGDPTPYERRVAGLVGRGHDLWDVVPAG